MLPFGTPAGGPRRGQAAHRRPGSGRRLRLRHRPQHPGLRAAGEHRGRLRDRAHATGSARPPEPPERWRAGPGPRAAAPGCCWPPSSSSGAATGPSPRSAWRRSRRSPTRCCGSSWPWPSSRSLMRGAGRLHRAGAGGPAHRGQLRPPRHRHGHRHDEHRPALRGGRASLDPRVHAAPLGRAHRGCRGRGSCPAGPSGSGLGARPRGARAPPQPGRHRLVLAGGPPGLRTAAAGRGRRCGSARPCPRPPLAGHALRRPDLAAPGRPACPWSSWLRSSSARSGPRSTGT